MRQGIKNFLWIILVLVAFFAFSALRGGTAMYLDFGEDAVVATAPEHFSHTVNYDAITNLELVDEFDPGTMISGGETRKLYWGTWKNDIWGEYTLCASKKIDNALLVTSSNGELLVLNYENEKTTEALLTLFSDLVANR